MPSTPTAVEIGAMAGSSLRANMYPNTEMPSPVSPYVCQPLVLNT